MPCFVFVFLGAPYMERLRSNVHVSAALTGITVAVVGVIANLSLYFALHTLFSDVRSRRWGPLQIEVPTLTSWNPLAFAVMALALILMINRKWPTMRTLGLCSGIGLVIGVVRLLAG